MFSELEINPNLKVKIQDDIYLEQSFKTLIYRLNKEVIEKNNIIMQQNALLLKQKDISDNQKKEFDNILEKIQKEKMKDDFLSLFSHELKTPLSVINSAIQAMEVLCKDEISPRTNRYIKIIKQNSYRQMRIVNNLLDITRVNAGKIKIKKKNYDIVFLTKVIVDSVNIYAEQKGIKIIFKSTVKKKIIGIDEEKYERILLNLLSNAIKFTAQNKNIYISLYITKGRVNVKVKDEGIGIPSNKANIIFERFGQVDSSISMEAEGTGIGLFLVKLLVDALGGTISVSSKEGKGSAFIISLLDLKTNESISNIELQALGDKRLIQAIAVEFSDIYIK
jgi:signal transduction histidine kinase